MPRVSLLLIDDRIVGPHLQLLRLVCNPSSTSRPHITVRFFERLPIPEEYERARVSHIDLMSPGLFRPKRNGPRDLSSGNHTVFIKCKSDDLTLLEHKPDFPGSDFHITVYDGRSRTFARDVLHELQRFKWGVRVPLSDQRGLTLKEIGSRSKKPPHIDRVYETEIRDLFLNVTSHELTSSYLANLDSRDRLLLCRAILKSLFQEMRDFERVSARRVAIVPRSAIGSASPKLPEVHLTPPELAHEIAAYAISQLHVQSSPVHFGDPAVGTGAFYGALLQLVPRERIASAIGVDVNSEQVAAAQWRWAERGMRVLNGDYLHMDRLPSRTLVLANPPYLRHQLIPENYKAQLLERASIRSDISISARSGLYVYFLLLAHDWMKEDAVAAWLIPSEFMRATYGSAVRQYLTEKVELIRVHVYGRTVPQFEGVEVSPAVVVFRKRKPSVGHTVTMTSGGHLDAPATQEIVTVEDLRLAPTWAIPLSRRQDKTSQLRIGDLFTVRRGIATGANQFFVMTRERARELGIPKSAVKPLLPKVRSLVTDIVESEPDGYPRVSPQLCVIDCDLPERAIRSRYPKLLKYLKTARGLGILDRTLLKAREPWYKQEQRDPAMFLCTYMGRGSVGKAPIRFIWNKSQAIATNTYLLLYPRPPLTKLLANNPLAASQLFCALQETASNGVEDDARVYAGGLLKIEPSGLLNVRVKAPDSLSLDGIKDQLEFF